MKNILIMFSATLFMLSCKEEKKEQIHLEDYNHLETKPTADSTTIDSTYTDSTKIPNSGNDTTAVDPKQAGASQN